MRRISFLLLIVSLFLGACSPIVILRTSKPAPTLTATANPLPTPLARTTAHPTATQVPDLGAKPEELRDVEVLVWHGWDGSSASLFQQMAGEFNLSNPWGIKVTVVAQQNLNLLAGAVEKSLNTTEHPDIVVALPEQILAWKAQVVDLENYLTQPDLGLSIQDIPPAFAEQSDLNGVRLGLPAARAARFLFYNLSFAHDLGFDQTPQSFDGFRKQACAANAFWKQDAILTNDGYGGLALDLNSNWLTPYTWLVEGGGKVFSGDVLQFNTPENIAALDFVSKLRQDNCAWLPDTTTNYENLATRRALFITGTLADLAGQSAAFSAALSPDQWTLLPFPGQKPGIVAYGPDYAVLKSNKTRQLASWLFIRWMLDGQNQARWSHETGLLPVTIPAITMLKSDPTTTPQWVAALDLIPNAVTYPRTPDWQIANKILADGYLTYTESFPNLTLENVLTTMDTTVQEMIKK